MTKHEQIPSIFKNAFHDEIENLLGNTNNDAYYELTRLLKWSLNDSISGDLYWTIFEDISGEEYSP